MHKEDIKSEVSNSNGLIGPGTGTYCSNSYLCLSPLYPLYFYFLLYFDFALCFSPSSCPCYGHVFLWNFSVTHASLLLLTYFVLTYQMIFHLGIDAFPWIWSDVEQVIVTSFYLLTYFCASLYLYCEIYVYLDFLTCVCLYSSNDVFPDSVSYDLDDREILNVVLPSPVLLFFYAHLLAFSPYLLCELLFFASFAL